LGNIFKDTAFRQDFPVGIIRSGAESLQDILVYSLAHPSVSVQDSCQIRVAFSVTAKLRNTAGHNLVWDNIFDNSANLKALFEKQVDSMFYIMRRKYL